MFSRPSKEQGKCINGGVEFGISRCKRLYIEWINNKVLLYNTGNYIQHPVVNHNGKEYEKCYIKLNHFVV